jgi:NAD(P)-dependent dehydrogenase (short-subunit alcohol dehydrogenase family)
MMADSTKSERGLAVVTGGAGDIGFSICRSLAQAGQDIIIADILEKRQGQSKAAELVESFGIAAKYMVCDQTKAEDVDAVFETAPNVSTVVVAAGIVQAQPFLDIDLAAWERQISVNLTGSFLCAQAGARNMIAAGTRGSIIFVSSWVAAHPWPEIAAYSVSKAGVDQLMRQVALELAPQGVRANAIAPGIVLAGLAKEQLENEPAYAARVATAIPLGELQTAEEIADAVAFLASPASRTMTGSVLLVDAGCSLGQVR